MNGPFSPGSGVGMQLALNNIRSLLGRETMKSLIATAALTFVFLSAGVVHSIGKNAAAVRPAVSHNITIVYKNQAWPVFEAEKVKVCQHVRCLDA
jgi:hypothetical protein